MQLITLCFTFALSLCTFVVVKCQDCSKDSFPRDLERNLDLSKLQDITSGNTLRLTCSIGYVGMSRFQCQTGTWKKQSGRPCERKSCGHPGDTPNGDFQLKDSDDFVFGARVEYSCKKGYQMVSRSTHRICLDQGWDNMIPICEAITCPVIRVNSDVVVIGESEDATFGNVIQFECQSNQKMLVGLSEIDCNHKGEWSGKVPTCEEIKCSAPEIANGRVNGAEQEYKENDLLKYSCFEKYIADGRTPRCTKIGNRAQWTPTPSCEKVKCLLSPIKGTEFTPSGQNVFSPGDDLIIKCQQGQWFFGTKLTEKRVRCNVDGTWSSPPNCEKITCDPPDDSLVQYSSWYGSWRRGDLKDTKDYRCKSGYKPTNGATYAECTNDGTWRPNPLCEEITCDPPQRSVLQYTQRPTKWVTGRFKDQIDYSCKPKFKPTNDATFAECTNDGTWTPNPLCEEQKIEESCLPPRNGFLVKKDSRSPTFYYSCNEKFKPSTSGWWGVATCTDGKWTEIPTCIDKSRCRGIHDIPNANVVSENDRKLTCIDGYTVVGKNTLKCTDGDWEMPLPECTRDAFVCKTPPKVENAVVKIPIQKVYKNGFKVKYECRKTFIIDGNAEITCTSGNWSEHPTCKQYCDNPNKHGKKMQLINEQDKYEEGSKMSYSCLSPHNYKGTEGNATCENGKWNMTVECVAICPDLPTVINGDVSIEKRNSEGVITEVTYACKTKYRLKGKKTIKCLKDKWTAPPTCELQS